MRIGPAFQLSADVAGSVTERLIDPRRNFLRSDEILLRTTLMKSAKIIVAYPQPKDAKAFDAVYQNEHVPLAVAKLQGETKIVATKVLQSPQGKPAFYCIAEVHVPQWRRSRVAPRP